MLESNQNKRIGAFRAMDDALDGDAGAIVMQLQRRSKYFCFHNL